MGGKEIYRDVRFFHRAIQMSFRATILHNQLFSEPSTVYRGKICALRHFYHCYLLVNKVSKSEGIRKVE